MTIADPVGAALNAGASIVSLTPHMIDMLSWASDSLSLDGNSIPSRGRMIPHSALIAMSIVPVRSVACTNGAWLEMSSLTRGMSPCVDAPVNLHYHKPSGYRNHIAVELQEQVLR